MQLWMVVL